MLEKDHRSERCSPHHRLARGRGNRSTRQTHVGKYLQLLKFAQMIAAELDFDKLFRAIIEHVCQLLSAERSSIFLIDDRHEYLCAFVSMDLKRDAFKIPKNKGIAGQVFCTKVPLLVNAPYECPLFNPEVDRKTGSITRNIISVPLISHTRDCIGTMQVLNKRQGDFTRADQHLMGYMASFSAVALENSLLYEEVKADALARGKAIDHLSHELKTPLAVISAAFERINTKIPIESRNALATTIARGRRNVDRLLDLQQKVNDILAGGSTDVDRAYAEMISELSDLFEELRDNGDLTQEVSTTVLRRLTSIHRGAAVQLRDIRLEDFLSDLSARTRERIADRRMDLRTQCEEGLTLRMDPEILEKCCSGLLKNAIENTPDGGVIRLTARQDDAGISIIVQDHGTGISAEHQRLIFHGFFHTQDTLLYSSKTPYAFNAGGAGADLLRIRRFAERLGFHITFSSARCPYLPAAADVCSGDTSTCRHIATAQGCAESGGSIFTLRFPTAAPQAGAAGHEALCNPNC